MLSEKMIRDLKPDGTARTYWDEQVKGFGVQVTPKGKKNFVVRYKVNARWVQRILCQAGPGNVRLADARVRASAIQAEARLDGSDPLGRSNAVVPGTTVAEGLDCFFDEVVPTRFAMRRMSPRTVRDYRQQAGQYVRPALGKLRIVDVTRDDVESMVAPLTPVRRNRILAFTSRLFNEFERRGLRPQNANPCRGIERAREEPRDRVLSGSELAALSSALEAETTRSPAAVAAIRFAAVTGLRISEVLNIEWQHVDLDSGRLVLPETKTGRRTHNVPSPAIDVLRGLPRINSWPFTAARDAPVRYDTVRKVFARISSAAGLEDVRLHDLRRTCMTMAAAAGVGTHILRDLLGHKTTVMADRYVRDVGSPVAEARNRVGAAVAAMMAGDAGGQVADPPGSEV